MILKIVDRATDKWKRLTYMTEAIIKKIIAFWSPHMSLFFISYMWVYLCTHSNNNNDDNDKMRHVLCLLMCLLKWQKNKNKNPWTVKNIKCESLLSFFFVSIYPPKSEKNENHIESFITQCIECWRHARLNEEEKKLNLLMW